MEGLNKFANNLINRYPGGGYTREIIISWVKDIIATEDMDKLNIPVSTQKNRDDDDDDAR